MKNLLIMALVFGVVACFALPAVALRAPDSVSLEVVGQAPVQFNHAAHVALANDCKDCHHYGVGNGKCTGCHGKTAQAPSLAEAYTACKTCHVAAPATDPVPASVPVPAASCSDYQAKDSCEADSSCSWSRWKGVCRDAR